MLLALSTNQLHSAKIWNNKFNKVDWNKWNCCWSKIWWGGKQVKRYKDVDRKRTTAGSWYTWRAKAFSSTLWCSQILIMIIRQVKVSGFCTLSPFFSCTLTLSLSLTHTISCLSSEHFRKTNHKCEYHHSSIDSRNNVENSIYTNHTNGIVFHKRWGVNFRENSIFLVDC